jgi:hypothetical protein
MKHPNSPLRSLTGTQRWGGPRGGADDSKWASAGGATFFSIGRPPGGRLLGAVPAVCIDAEPQADIASSQAARPTTVCGARHEVAMPMGDRFFLSGSRFMDQ